MRLSIAALLVFATAVSGLSWGDIEKSAKEDNRHLIVKRQAPTECADLKGYCKQWAKRGHCARPKYRAYMRKNCKVSCGICTAETKTITATTAIPEENCIDNHRSCARWKEQNYCQNPKYRTFMKQKCRKTCKFCQDPSDTTTTKFVTIAITAPKLTTIQSTTNQYPTTQSKSTQAPTTQPTTTDAPITQSTTSDAPTTNYTPTTQSTTTDAPTTQSTTTDAPTTQSTTNYAPTTQSTTTDTPTTQSRTTDAPTTQSSSTLGSTTPTRALTTSEAFREVTDAEIVTTEEMVTTANIQTTDVTTDYLTTEEITTEALETTESELTTLALTTLGVTTEFDETTAHEQTTLVEETTTDEQLVTDSIFMTTTKIPRNETTTQQVSTSKQTTVSINGFLTSTVQEEMCEDRLTQCRDLISYCVILDVRIQCRKTCGVCQTTTISETLPQSSTTGAPTTTKPITEFITSTATEVTTELPTKEQLTSVIMDMGETTSVATIIEQPCKDSMSRCSSFVFYCKASEYVKEVCPLTCNVCQDHIKMTSTTIASPTSEIGVTSAAIDTTITTKNTAVTFSTFKEVTEQSQTNTVAVETSPSSDNSTLVSDVLLTSSVYTSSIPRQNGTTTQNVATTEQTTIEKESTMQMTQNQDVTNPSVSTTEIDAATYETKFAEETKPSTESIVTFSATLSDFLTSVSTTMQVPTTVTIPTSFIGSTTTESTTAPNTNGCVDKFKVCSSYSKTLCTTEVFRNYCIRYCGLCDNIREELTTSILPAVAATTISSNNCKDSSLKCPEYKKYCNVSNDVRRLCKQSCNTCGEMALSTTSSTPRCLDYSSECPNMVSYCTDSPISADVVMQCPKTCNLCSEEMTTSPQETSSALTTTSVTAVEITTAEMNATSDSGCRDYFGQCDKLISFCETRQQVQTSCPLTCGKCTPIPNTSTSNEEGTEEFIVTTSIPTTVATFRPTTIPPQTTAETEEEEICEDKFARCGEIRSKCREVASLAYLRVSCRKTCGFCNSNSSEFEFYEREWSTWSPCSATCGQGIQTRRQVCVDPNVICPNNMPMEQRGCRLRECFKNGECGNRLADASCEKYKGRGACGMPAISGLCLKTCNQCPGVENNGANLPYQPPKKGNYSPWSNWGACSAECGQGIMNRSRTCQPPVQGVESIICDGPPIEEMACMAKSCISAGNTSGVCEDKNERCESWSQKGYCERKYTKYMSKHCAVSCSICGRWGSWGDWSACSTSCGGGIQQRSRFCDTLGCVGDYEEKATCNPQICEAATCVDLTSSCQRIDRNVQCREAFYSSVCKRTCGLCPADSGGCIDRHPQCPDAAAAGRCTDVRFLDLCPKSCNACRTEAKDTPVSQCFDKINTCVQMRQTINCRDPYVQENCKATCGLCAQTTTQPACEDKVATCAMVASANECRNPTVAQSCPKSCQLCQTQQFPNGLCLDDSMECPNYASQGRCRDRVVAMQCKKSCRQCKARTADLETCIDQNEKCTTYKQMGYCQNPTIQQQCPLSCEMCGGKCEDKVPRCPELSQMGYCNNPDVAKSCGKSCNVCQQNAALNALCKDESELCPTYAKLKYCEMEQIAQRCRKSCNTCPKVADSICTDNTAQCFIYKAAKLCNNTAVSKLCPLSCGKCGCKDSMTQCPMLVSTLKCATQFVAQQCKKSCGNCPGTAKADNCNDKINNCQLVKNMEQCHMPELGNMCQKTCHLCGLTRNCNDGLTGCPQAAKMGLCSSGNINMVCRKSCGICTPTAEPLFDDEGGEEKWDWETATPVETLMCADKRDNCESMREKGFCSQKIIRDTCNMTCRVCVPTNPGKLKVPEGECIDGTEECTLLTQGDSCTTDERIKFLCAKSCDTCIADAGEKTTKSTECRDTIDCADKANECDVPEIKKTCKKTCGVCDTEGANPNPGEYGPSTSYGQCRDRMRGCSETKCKMVGYQAYIQKMCAKTCGFCEDNYGVWGNWGSCTVSCGGGTRKRNRVCREGKVCEEPSPVDFGTCGKEKCEGDKEKSEERVCKDYREQCAEWAKVSRCEDFRYKFQMAEQCRLSCGLCVPEKVGEWSECSVTCGGGTRTRTRGDGVDVERCNTNDCKIGWSQWSQWSECDVTCGNGENLRTRECLGENEEVLCEGPYEEISTCETGNICPDVGEWGPWVDGTCDVTCGEGVLKRERICRNGVPGRWGCQGKSTVTAICNMPACPTSWSEWSSWSSCTKSCDSGMKSRERTRTIYCEDDAAGCSEEDEQFERCNTQECNPAAWGAWQAWTTCTATCGGGSALRQRFCEKEGLRVRSKRCNGTKENRFQSGDCQTQPCPVWGPWIGSECSASCGIGVQKFERACINGDTGSTGCSEGENIKYETCEKANCTQACQAAPVSVENLNKTAFRESVNDTMNGWDGSKWCLRPIPDTQWIEIDFGENLAISGVEIEGIIYGKYLVTTSSPMTFDLSHSPIVSDNKYHYRIHKENVKGPTKNNIKVDRSWAPVTDRVWRISTKLPTDFTCFNIKFQYCTREENKTRETKKIAEDIEEVGSGEMF